MESKWATLRGVAAASVVMLGLAAPAGASIVGTFTTKTGWEGSLTAIETADFNDTLANGTWHLYNNAAGYTSGLMQFLGEKGAGPSYELKRIEEGGERWLVGPNWTVASNDPRIKVVLSNAATAFGVNIGSSIAGITYRFTVVQNSGTDVVDMSSAAAQAPSTSFFGFHTNSPIIRVEVRMLGGVADGGNPEEESRLNDVFTGLLSNEEPPPPPEEVPEPSTVFSAITGAALVAWARRRRAARQ